LCLCKFGLGSVLGISDGLHKYCPLRINAIPKLISHVVLMAIDGVVASRSIITKKPGKYMGPLQHINIIERTRQSKKIMPHP
jgi:hypothetical protein